MNVVIVDGKLCSDLEVLPDARRCRIGRFSLETRYNETISIEVRGEGVAMVSEKWNPGDVVQVRGRIRAGGIISADSLKRISAADGGREPFQLRWPFRSQIAARPSNSLSGTLPLPMPV